MKELWLIITVAVGILSVISVALLAKKKQAFRDDAFLTLGRNEVSKIWLAGLKFKNITPLSFPKLRTTS
jgi:hypothetical protein